MLDYATPTSQQDQPAPQWLIRYLRILTIFFGVIHVLVLMCILLVINDFNYYTFALSMCVHILIIPYLLLFLFTKEWSKLSPWPVFNTQFSFAAVTFACVTPILFSLYQVYEGQGTEVNGLAIIVLGFAQIVFAYVIFFTLEISTANYKKRLMRIRKTETIW